MNIDNDLVPTVDVDDFKLAWKMSLEHEQSSGGKLGVVAYVGDPPPSPFKPETDRFALRHRMLMLGLLLAVAKQVPEQMPAILRENPLPGIVLRTIPDIPMTYAVTRKVNRGWAFDPEELYRRIGAAA